MFVEVLLVLGQHGGCVMLVDDEDPVQQLAAQAADEPFGDGVRPRRPDWCGHDLDAGGIEHGVDDLAELAVVIAEEEPERLAGVVQVHQQICRPAPARLEDQTAWIVAVAPSSRSSSRPSARASRASRAGAVARTTACS